MYTLKGGRICGRVVLLLSLLAISILPSIGVKTVYASEASANWHTTEGWPSTPPYNWSECWPDEVDVSEDVVYYIFQKFISLDYEWTMFSSQYTTAYNILSVANSMDTYDYAAVFLYAHGCNYTEYGYVDFGEEPIPIPVEHYRAFMGPLGDSSDDLYDWDLGYTNEDGGHHFVFMWECMSANIVGYWDYDDWIYDEEMGWGWYTGTGAVGWAYPWMREGAVGMSEDGYGYSDQGEYCFIEFETFSPPLTNVTGSQGKTLVDFVETFYNKTLQTENRETINEALDYAAYEAYGVDYFWESPLYEGWDAYVPPPEDEYWHTSMRVFGNGTNYLSIG